MLIKRSTLFCQGFGRRRSTLSMDVLLPLFITGVTAATRPLFAISTPGLRPWELLSLNTFSPSYRPGTVQYSVITITITDPNDHPPTWAVDCTAKWDFESLPYGQMYNCSEAGDAQWSFEMLKADSAYSSPTQDFVLRFMLTRYSETFEGSARFAVGDNLRGLCSASGVCAFQLKEDHIPFPIPCTKNA